MSFVTNSPALSKQSGFHSTFKAFELANFRWFFTSLFGN
ncbi:uncharacterized protein METZ01_LOCUS327955, partial [marine metagenome]